MAVSTTPRLAKLTYEDLLTFPEDGKRHEIIDGEHCVSPAPNLKHQAVSVRLAALLHSWAERTGAGEVFAAPTDVLLSRVDVVEPDLLFISRQRTEILTKTAVKGAPDLVVEILSEATRKRDEVTKRRRYERFGVAEYWVVDPVLESIKVYRLRGGRYERAAELSAEARDTLTSPLLSGLKIRLVPLFAWKFD